MKIAKVVMFLCALTVTNAPVHGGWFKKTAEQVAAEADRKNAEEIQKALGEVKKQKDAIYQQGRFSNARPYLTALEKMTGVHANKPAVQASIKQALEGVVQAPDSKFSGLTGVYLVGRNKITSAEIQLIKKEAQRILDQKFPSDVDSKTGELHDALTRTKRQTSALKGSLARLQHRLSHDSSPVAGSLSGSGSDSGSESDSNAGSDADVE